MESYEISEVTPNYLTIRANFDHPDLIDHYDLLRIDILESKVLAGTVLFVPIYQYIEPETAELLVSLVICLGIATLITVLITLTSGMFSGSIMPLWMFLNSI
jgi:hypothetical protein